MRGRRSRDALSAVPPPVNRKEPESGVSESGIVPIALGLLAGGTTVSAAIFGDRGARSHPPYERAAGMKLPHPIG